MKLKLYPEAPAARALADTLTVCNAAANQVAAVATATWATQGRLPSGYDLRALTYGMAKTHGLGSQAAQQVIRKVHQSYKTLSGTLRTGRYGKAGSARRERIRATPITFRPDAAQPFDDRCLSFDDTSRTISIWTVAGRVRVPFTASAAQLADVAAHRAGESDLLMVKTRRGVQFYLVVTCDTADVPVTDSGGFIGVDMGTTVLAATSTGTDWSGGAVEVRRKRNRLLRKRLQAKGTKSAKRLLVARSKKEHRFATDVNHVISKKIVSEAERTGKGIAVEELTGIRDRVQHRRSQRDTFTGWSFHQLRAFLDYKAARAGVAFLAVDPAYTSQDCSACGHRDKASRRTQADFTCTRCGVSLNADTNAARNIATRGAACWAAQQSPALT